MWQRKKAASWVPRVAALETKIWMKNSLFGRWCQEAPWGSETGKGRKPPGANGSVPPGNYRRQLPHPRGRGLGYILSHSTVTGWGLFLEDRKGSIDSVGPPTAPGTGLPGVGERRKPPSCRCLQLEGLRGDGLRGTGWPCPAPTKR